MQLRTFYFFIWISVIYNCRFAFTLSPFPGQLLAGLFMFKVGYYLQIEVMYNSIAHKILFEALLYEYEATFGAGNSLAVEQGDVKHEATITTLGKDYNRYPLAFLSN